MKFFSEFFVIFCAFLVYNVESGGDTWPRTVGDENFVHSRFLSFPSGCANIPIEAKFTARTTARELRKVQRRFDEALSDNDMEPTLEILKKFVDSYSRIEISFIEEIPTYFDIDLNAFIDVIHNFGINATEEYLCAYELFGEGVGDNIDVYEYYLKNLRHDLIGYPHDADEECDDLQAVESAVTIAIRNIKNSYNHVKRFSDPDYYLTAYNFIEAFERVIWNLFHKLKDIYDLDHELWKEAIVHNGEDAIGKYLCAYAAYYTAEHRYVEAYMKIMADIIQRTKHFSFDYEFNDK